MMRTPDDRVLDVLRRLGLSLNILVDSADIDLGDVSQADRQDAVVLLTTGAKRAGIFVKETSLDARDLRSVLLERLCVVAAHPDGRFTVFEKVAGTSIEVSRVGDEVRFETLSPSQIKAMLRDGTRLFVAKRELECSTLSSPKAQHTALVHSAHHHGHGGHGGHVKPLRRFLALLRLDIRDVTTITVFALVAGILALATPLAIESLVNVVSWGTYLQPLLVLSLMLLACLGLAGFLRILQNVVVEMIQRRQLVRLVGDFAHRFPRSQQAALAGHYPRELANRVFDIMTIQKASAILLLDGLNIVTTTLLGLLLLAFYHPFLLGFDIVLLLSMVSITWLLGRGGVATAIEESLVKYQIAHWLQDILSSPTPFKVNGGELLAVERANRLTTQYLVQRQRQFRVVLRQVAFAIFLQVVASTVLLGLGGWLVMQQQLTLGQLVASELVVTMIVGAFAKAGKALEKFYDLMAGVDKVGHLLDIPVDPRFEIGELPSAPVDVRWEDISLRAEATGQVHHLDSAHFAAGSRVALVGDSGCKSQLLLALAGICHVEHGLIEVGGFEAERAVLAGQGRVVGYAGRVEIFHAALHENVDLGRGDVGHIRVREVLGQVGLWDAVLQFPNGVKTVLESDGSPLTKTQCGLLMLAQAMAGKPRLLLIDGILDYLPDAAIEHVWQTLSDPQAPWTLIIATNRASIAARCTTKFEIESE